jgi:DNA-binding GntR family transcriptional regulator
MFPQNVQHVYEEIRAEILGGVYKPGQPLPEIPLATKYGIKRTRIRQIIQELERDALIDRIPTKGAFVKSITPKDLQEIFEMREALEGMAAKLAARKRSEEDLSRIIRLFEECKKDSGDRDMEKKVKMGESLHQFILQSCGNGRIVSAMEPLKMQIIRIWKTGFDIPDRVNKAFKEHIEILTGLKEKNGEVAERRMKEHLSNAFKDYIRIMVLNEWSFEEGSVK